MMTYSNNRRMHDILVHTKHEIMKELACYHILENPLARHIIHVREYFP